MMKITDRIQSIVQREGISTRALEKTIGCSNGVLSRGIQKGTDISSIWASKIIESFPKYSALWLLTGKDPMLLGEGSPPGQLILEDGPPRYGSCEKCKIKDELIESLRGQVKTLKKLVRNLESEKSSSEVEQKRKEAS